MKHFLSTKRLKNGTKILFVNVPGSTSYYFNTICNGGFNYAQKSQYELPHLLEHLAFRGSKKYPQPAQMAYELEKIGGWSNAITYDRLIRYFLVGSIRDYEKITSLALEQYCRPLFKEKNIKEQKQVIERELMRSVDDDGSRVRSLTYTKLFPSKLSFEKDRIATLANITRADITKFYKLTHTQANTSFVIAGDLPAAKQEKITNSIERTINELAAGEELEKLHPLSNQFSGKINTLNSNLEGQVYFDLTFVKDNYNADPKYLAACRVASAIYNRGDGSRIFQKARAAGLAYGVNSGISNNKDFSELYIIDRTDPHLTTKLFELCVRELNEIVTGKYGDEELERAIGYEAGEYDTEYENSRDLADWYGPMFVDKEKLYSPTDFAKHIRATRREDVKKVLDSFVTKGNWVISLVGKNADKYKPELQKVINKYFS